MNIDIEQNSIVVGEEEATQNTLVLSETFPKVLPLFGPLTYEPKNELEANEYVKMILSPTNKSGQHTQQVLVTPLVAKALLTFNTKNRPLNRRKVNLWAKKMLAKQWNEQTNDMICFALTYVLINGQHRLHAIVETGVSLLLNISTNMDEEAGKTMDLGKGRTAGDIATQLNEGKKLKYHDDKVADVSLLQRGFGASVTSPETNDDIAVRTLELDATLEKLYKTFGSAPKQWRPKEIRTAFLNFMVRYPNHEQDILDYAKVLIDPMKLEQKQFSTHPLKKFKSWYLKNVVQPKEVNPSLRVQGRYVYAHLLGALDKLIAKNKFKCVRSEPLIVDPYTGTQCLKKS